MMFVEPHDAETGTSRLRLQTIVRLRWFAVAGQLTAILIVFFGFGFDLPLVPCLVIITMSAALNGFLRMRSPGRHRLGTRLAMALLAYDILQLAALLYLTGGIDNPFTFLIVAPVTVSAAGLPWRNTVVLGALAIATTLLLIPFHAPLPWYAGQTFGLPMIYKFGAVASVASSMVFLALYAGRLAKEARQMAQALAATEHVLAREQKLHAIDGLAAAAAHELGTPLSTITLVAKELQRELPPGSPFAEDAALLKSQADRCREILRKLTRSPTAADPLHEQLTVSQLIEEAASPYRAFDTQIVASAQPMEGTGADASSEPTHVRRPGVVYGLGNLIENAADFANSRVDVSARWDKTSIVCTIADDGPGFAPGVLDRLGEPYVTTRSSLDRIGDDDESGLGLGFFIAKTLLERSGAMVEFANRSEPQSGALVRITWPRPVFEGASADAPWPARSASTVRTDGSWQR